MEDDRWEQFVIDIMHLMDKVGAEVYSHAYGTGIWDGIIEESFLICFACPSAGVIQDELAFLAYLYEQDSIAFTLGRTQLVTP